MWIQNDSNKDHLMVHWMKSHTHSFVFSYSSGLQTEDPLTHEPVVNIGMPKVTLPTESNSDRSVSTLGIQVPSQNAQKVFGVGLEGPGAF